MCTSDILVFEQSNVYFSHTWIRRVQCVLLIYLYLDSQMGISHILGLGQFNMYFLKIYCTWIRTIQCVLLTYVLGLGQFNVYF